MARDVLFVQGGGEGTYEAWDNKLVDSLQRELGPGYAITYPRMPKEDEPDYARWAATLKTEIARLGKSAIVVGHSIGGTILIHALAANPPEVALSGIFLLAAPFIGKGGWPSDDFELPEEKLGALAKDVPVYLYHGSADDIVPLTHLDLYAQAIPHAVTRRLDGRNHQLDDDLSEVAQDIRSLV